MGILNTEGEPHSFYDVNMRREVLLRLLSRSKTKRPQPLTGREARVSQLNNLFSKLDIGGATPHKTRERVKAAGYLAAKELQEQQ